MLLPPLRERTPLWGLEGRTKLMPGSSTKKQVATTVGVGILTAPASYVAQRVLGAWGVLDDISDALGVWLRINVSPEAAGWTIALVLVLGFYGLVLWRVWRPKHDPTDPTDVKPVAVENRQVTPSVANRPPKFATLDDETKAKLARLTDHIDRTEREERARAAKEIVEEIRAAKQQPPPKLSGLMATEDEVNVVRAAANIQTRLIPLGISQESLKELRDRSRSEVLGNALHCTFQGDEDKWASPQEKQSWMVRNRLLDELERVAMQIERSRQKSEKGDL